MTETRPFDEIRLLLASLPGPCARSVAAVRARVVGDVQQHIELRQELLEKGYLGPARMWDSKSAEPLAAYSP